MKRKPDVVLKNFSEIDMQKVAFIPIIAIYKHPTDYPEKYVARIWDILKEPTQYIVISDNIEDLRQSIPPGMNRLMPFAQDDPVIVETWL